jgi:phosphatidylglycerol:prolipoprotein diacylglycerol transferase
LYYGVVRMSLEPLRDERYKYVMTYVMTGIWIVAGVIAVILNQTVLWRIRKYKVSEYLKQIFKTNKKDIKHFVRKENEMSYFFNR